MAHVRTNGGASARLHSNPPFAEGTFKVCRKATYEDGPRQGQSCVVKEFKQGSVFEANYFQEEMRVVTETEDIVEAFNKAGVLGYNTRVRVNRPNIATHYSTGAKVLVEPYIAGFQKFNSNSGWAENRGESAQAMQALSHFSYHYSNGQYLLCDVQGGAYADGFVLTDPIIMSRSGNCGPGDLGQEGIYNFFRKHRCNQFCRSSWRKPGRAGGERIPSQKGTAYGGPLRIRQDRNPLTWWYGY